MLGLGIGGRAGFEEWVSLNKGTLTVQHHLEWNAVRFMDGVGGLSDGLKAYRKQL
jgi:hypothetical protein